MTSAAAHPSAPATSATREPMLRAEGVSMIFGRGDQAVNVLDNVSLEVGKGEFVCLLGPSGCGKSTMLNVIAGFLTPTSGRVLIDGQAVRGPDRRRVFVFQERGVFPQAERETRIAHNVEMVGLKGFEKAYPRELSGGMKQRVEVARALAVDPDMLYLDEPFGALDSITRLVMRSELLRIWEAERKTIIFVTHDIDEAVQLSDRVIVLSARPAKIQTIVDIDMPHPRDISSPRYLELRDGILDAIGLAHKV